MQTPERHSCTEASQTASPGRNEERISAICDVPDTDKRRQLDRQPPRLLGKGVANWLACRHVLAVIAYDYTMARRNLLNHSVERQETSVEILSNTVANRSTCGARAEPTLTRKR